MIMGKYYITIPVEVIEILKTLPIESFALYIELLQLDVDSFYDYKVDIKTDCNIDWMTVTIKQGRSKIMKKTNVKTCTLAFDNAWTDLLNSGLVVNNKDWTITLTKLLRINNFLQLTEIEENIKTST